MQTELLWNIILTLVVIPLGWFLSQINNEVRRLHILVNRTREDYVRRADHVEETDRILEHLRRLEDKLDRFLERN